MLGSNVKVHFAGSDGSKENFCALVAADTRYRLYSCYNYIVNKKPDDDFRLPEDDIILEQQKQQNHITASCVEIDCQKVLGPEEAWYFRQRMRDLLPENKQINVFHFEDGLKGLDRLIEFADYIAVSVPEWRIVKPATHKQDIRYITHYIKNKKPEIDIHLLGCTDFKIIRENNFCTSADSTSWLSGVKYGYFNDGIKKEHIRNFKRSLYNEREAQVKAMMLARGIEPTGKKLVYTTNASLCATICKDLYARTCGPQD